MTELVFGHVCPCEFVDDFLHFAAKPRRVSHVFEELGLAVPITAPAWIYSVVDKADGDTRQRVDVLRTRDATRKCKHSDALEAVSNPPR